MRLAVNIDHVATLRNARGEEDPDPVVAALIAELTGAAGIVCHLREDRRHIRDHDLAELRKQVTTKLDLEMAMTDELQQIAIKTKPELITLVPEKREELTTEGGFDIARHFTRLRSFLTPIHDAGIEISLFIEPEETAIDLAKEAGAQIVELHTGRYAMMERRAPELERIRHAATYAKKQGLRVVAGHGLNYTNITPIVDITEIEEVSIGHAIMARAMFSGLELAVKDMLRLLGNNQLR